MSLLVICASSLVKCLPKSVAHFLKLFFIRVRYLRFNHFKVCSSLTLITFTMFTSVDFQNFLIIPKRNSIPSKQ